MKHPDILQKSDCCERLFCTSGKNRNLPGSKNTRKSIIAAGRARVADRCPQQDKGAEGMAKVEVRVYPKKHVNAGKPAVRRHKVVQTARLA